MMKKIISTILVLALVAGISIAGTVAYLTDRDSKANVFTVGDVDITLNEDFAQGSTLVPGVSIEKAPSIENNGKNEAYVWATVTVPKGLVSVIDIAKNTTDWVWSEADEGVYVVKSLNPLAAGAETAPLFTTVALNSKVDIAPDGKWYVVNNGVAEPTGWTNGDGNPVINVSAYAMQTEGFENVDDAIVAYGEQWGDKGGAAATVPTVAEVSTADELKAALAAGGNIVLTADIDLGATQLTVAGNATLNLNGKDLTGAYEGTGHYAMFTVPNGASLTVVGNGNLTATTKFAESNRSGALFLNAGKLTLNGGNYKLTDSTEGKTWIIATIVDNRTNSASCETVLTINGGEYTVAGNAKNLFRNYPQQGGSATLTINDGKFNDCGTTTYIWNQESRDYPGKLNFLGGTYGSNVVYEDYNGQSDVVIAEGVVIGAYSGNT